MQPRELGPFLLMNLRTAAACLRVTTAETAENSINFTDLGNGQYLFPSGTGTHKGLKILHGPDPLNFVLENRQVRREINKKTLDK